METLEPTKVSIDYFLPFILFFRQWYICRPVFGTVNGLSQGL
jgi:hypothetical protein